MVGHFERVSETAKDNPTTMKSEIVRKNSPVIHLLVVASGLLPLSLTAQQINRTVLPVPEPLPPTITELDARTAKAPRHWQRCCDSMATAPLPSASITKRLRGRSRFPDRSIVGRLILVSINFTVLSVARPISGLLPFLMEPYG